MNDTIILQKSCYVYLKEKGEICNRLNKGTKVHCLKTKGKWIKITWRGGKKKGWIQRPTSALKMNEN